MQHRPIGDRPVSAIGLGGMPMSIEGRPDRERSIATIHAALEAGDYATARALIAGMTAFEDIRAEEMNGTNVTGVKAALLAQGLDCGPTRPPSAWPLTAAQQDKLDRFMAANNLCLKETV